MYVWTEIDLCQQIFKIAFLLPEKVGKLQNCVIQKLWIYRHPGTLNLGLLVKNINAYRDLDVNLNAKQQK